MFSSVNLNYPVKKQKPLYFPPTGCSPNLCCFILTHILVYRQEHWSAAFWVMYYYCNTCYVCTQAHKRKKYFPGGTRYSTLLQTSKQQLWQKSAFIMQRSLQRSRSHKKICVQFPSFVRNQGRGQSQVLRQVHAETAICNEPGFPKEQGSSSCSLNSSIPRQILKSDSSFLLPFQLSKYT